MYGARCGECLRIMLKASIITSSGMYVSSTIFIAALCAGVVFGPKNTFRSIVSLYIQSIVYHS